AYCLATRTVPLVVVKFPARSRADTFTVYVPPPEGVGHSSLGLPPATVALLVKMIFEPFSTLIVTVEIFDSETWTPARVPPFRVRLSSVTTGGVFSYSPNFFAVVQ